MTSKNWVTIIWHSCRKAWPSQILFSTPHTDIHTDWGHLIEPFQSVRNMCYAEKDLRSCNFFNGVTCSLAGICISRGHVEYQKWKSILTDRGSKIYEPSRAITESGTESWQDFLKINFTPLPQQGNKNTSNTTVFSQSVHSWILFERVPWSHQFSHA